MGEPSAGTHVRTRLWPIDPVLSPITAEKTFLMRAPDILYGSTRQRGPFEGGVEEPATPDVKPKPASPDIPRPDGPNVPSEVPEKPEVPVRPPKPEPGISPGKPREPEVPTPAEPHEGMESDTDE